MVKLMFTIKFRSDMSTKEAHLYWRTTHRDLSLATPGVVAYTQNLKVEDLSTDVPWDGIVELTFADEDAYRAAMTSEEWRSTYTDVINFLDADKITSAVVEAEHLR